MAAKMVDWCSRKREAENPCDKADFHRLSDFIAGIVSCLCLVNNASLKSFSKFFFLLNQLNFEKKYSIKSYARICFLLSKKFFDFIESLPSAPH